MIVAITASLNVRLYVDEEKNDVLRHQVAAKGSYIHLDPDHVRLLLTGTVVGWFI